MMQLRQNYSPEEGRGWYPDHGRKSSVGYAPHSFLPFPGTVD